MTKKDVTLGLLLVQLGFDTEGSHMHSPFTDIFARCFFEPGYLDERWPGLKAAYDALEDE